MVELSENIFESEKLATLTMNFVTSKLSAVIVKLNKYKCYQVENFFDVIRPFHYIAKLYGYSPFTLPKDTSWGITLQSTSIDVIVSIVSFTLYFVLLYTQLSMEKLYSHGVLVIDIAEDVLVFYLTCVSLLSTALLLLLRRQVWFLINEFVRIDSKVSKFKIKVKLKKIGAIHINSYI